MHLSIFNFKRVYKVLILFSLFFLFYNIYLITVKPKVTVFQNQWQKNYSFAQNFIYENNAQHIIVGSSLATRLEKKFLPDDYYNLSFTGGSVLTGLAIVKRSGFIPQNIFIETNIIFRDKDEEMLDFIFYPIWWKIKRYLPALREKYQPLNLLIGKIKNSYGKTHEEQMKDRQNIKIYEANIEIYQKGYAVKVENYKEKLKELKKLIVYLENKGINIVFFEMPVDKSIIKSVRYQQQKKIIQNNFDNKWLNSSESKQYITTDGIHLLYKSAYHFTKIFLHESKRYLK